MPETSTSEASWLFAVSLEDLWEGEMMRVRLAGHDVLLVRLAGFEIRAYDNRCPHAGAPLSEGLLQASTLRCAHHLWEFDARTGLGVNPRRCNLRSFPVKVVDARVFVQLAAYGSNAITP